MTSLPHDLAARILDGSPDAVLVCDRTGVVRYWNPAAERVFGFRQAEAVGASMDLIIPEVTADDDAIPAFGPGPIDHQALSLSMISAR